MERKFIQIWDVYSGEYVEFEAPDARILQWSPDGTLLASSGTDGTVRVWGVEE